VLQQTQKYQDKPVLSAEAVKGYEDQWQNPEKYAALYYNQVSDQEGPLQPPYRMSPAQPPVAILGAAESSKQSITDILNMHAPIMGGDSQEISGVAIGMRQRQSETAQFHLQDNLNKSIRHCARILLGLYQALYTVPMMRRIIGPDGESKTIQLFDQTAEGILADVTIGRYDVRMDTGPSYNTQREQNFQMIMQLLQMNPQLFAVIGDILLQNSPLLNAKEIAERIKKTMPPNLLGEDGEINPEQAKAQIQQMDQVIQKMTADIEKLQKLVDDKDQERQLEMFKAQLQAEKDIQVAKINASSRSDVQELRGVVELLKQRIDISNAPPNWVQQGEGVDNYTPSQDLTSLPVVDDSPPDPAQPDMQNPAIEQGFLMPEEMNQMQQDNLAPEPDQLGESAMIENGVMPLMEQDNGPEL
jgi:polyhydroxyalkanoate synthesis regulator phasin